jgi:hypothetical protein
LAEAKLLMSGPDSVTAVTGVTPAAAKALAAGVTVVTAVTATPTPSPFRKEEGGYRRATARSEGRAPGAVTAVTVVTWPLGDAPHQADPRLHQLWFARASDSTGCGLAAPTFRPVVCPARRRGGRRASATAAVPRARPEPRFGADPRPARNARRRARKRE